MFGDDDKGVEYFRAAKLSIQWQLLISALMITAFYKVYQDPHRGLNVKQFYIMQSK
jgi:hypothetical protein